MNDATKKLIAGAEKLAKERPNRRRPSPSSIARCTRQNWFSEHDVEATNPTSWDAESFAAAESGRYTEPLLINIVEAAGFGTILRETEAERELQPHQLRRIAASGGQYDALMTTFNEQGGEDDLVLVEFKRKAVFNFLDVAQKGCREGASGDFSQIQTLLYALMLERCLYVAVNWDRSALTRNTKHWKEGRPAGYYAEWIHASKVAGVMAKQRAMMQQEYMKQTNPRLVPRDYNPHGGQGADWQCRWCPFWKDCIKVDGGK